DGDDIVAAAVDDRVALLAASLEARIAPAAHARTVVVLDDETIVVADDEPIAGLANDGPVALALLFALFSEFVDVAELSSRRRGLRPSEHLRLDRRLSNLRLDRWSELRLRLNRLRSGWKLRWRRDEPRVLLRRKLWLRLDRLRVRKQLLRWRLD